MELNAGRSKSEQSYSQHLVGCPCLLKKLRDMATQTDENDQPEPNATYVVKAETSTSTQTDDQPELNATYVVKAETRITSSSRGGSSSRVATIPKSECLEATAILPQPAQAIRTTQNSKKFFSTARVGSKIPSLTDQVTPPSVPVVIVKEKQPSVETPSPVKLLSDEDYEDDTMNTKNSTKILNAVPTSTPTKDDQEQKAKRREKKYFG